MQCPQGGILADSDFHCGVKQKQGSIGFNPFNPPQRHQSQQRWHSLLL
jgi:hypothetical protein